MKKYAVIIYLLLLSMAMLISYVMPTIEADAQSSSTIPEDAIRLRILANSNSVEDQHLKIQIRDRVKTEMDSWVIDIKSKEEARKVIESKLPEIEKISNEEIAKSGLNQVATVELGQAEFPTKLYGDYLYPAGHYEALVIKLGEAEGNNWWCVLYPPLCFLDIDSGTATKKVVSEKKQPTVEQKTSDKGIKKPAKKADKKKQEKVQFLSKKVINKFF